MVQLSHIDFRYPGSDFQLKIDTLVFDACSRTAIIGPSGFGKTTMLNLLAGILLPDSGTVQVQDTMVHKLSEKERRNFRAQRIGFVFQDFRLINYLNVLDNILLPFRINRVLKLRNETGDMAFELAQQLGIADKLRKYPSKLSHGERQRVAICRALLTKPTILLADEPTGNLDPENKANILKILFDYVDSHRATLITVTHDHQMLGGFDRTIDFANFQRE